MLHVVFGGAGFLGSTLVDALSERREEVIAVDDLSSGRLANLQSAIERRRVTFLYGDVESDPAGVAAHVARVARGRRSRVYVAMGASDAVLRCVREIDAELVVLRHWPDGGVTARMPSGVRVMYLANPFGPRMPAAPGSLLWEIFAKLAAGAAAPIGGIEHIAVPLTYSRDAARYLVNASAEGSGNDERFCPAATATVFGVASIAATLSGVQLRIAPALVDCLEVPVLGESWRGAAGLADLRRALRETQRWFAARREAAA